MGTVLGAVLVGAIAALAWLGWRRGGAVAVIVVLALHALAQDHHVDDAGIVYAFAENLAAGRGLVPQPGALPVEGVSDPLWTALLVPAPLVGVDTGVWSGVLQAGLMVWTLFLLGRVARAAGASSEGVAVARLVTATSGVVFAWTAAGLEGALLAALLTWTAWAAASRFGPGVFLGVFLCAWTRPEGAVAGLGAAAAGVMLHRHWRTLAWAVSGGLLGFASLHGLRWAWLGTVWPTSATAKLGTPSWRYVLGGIVYAGEALALAGIPVLAVGWVRTDAPRRWVAPLALALGAGVFLAVASGGDWMRHGRYLAPYLPLAFAFAVPPVVAAWNRGVWARIGLVGLILVGWGVLVDATLRPTVPVDHGLRRGRLYHAIGQSVCDETSVATPDIGGVLWRWPEVRVVDLAGLIDADAALGRTRPDYWEGRIRAEQPALIDLHDSWGPRTGLTPDTLDELGYRVLSRRRGRSPDDAEAPTLWVRTDCRGALSGEAERLLAVWAARGSGESWE